MSDTSCSPFDIRYDLGYPTTKSYNCGDTHKTGYFMQRSGNVGGLCDVSKGIPSPDDETERPDLVLCESGATSCTLPLKSETIIYPTLNKACCSFQAAT